MSSRSQRFSRADRLNNPSDYRAVFKSAKRSADSNFLILYSENHRDKARLGLAISKKRIQSAVQRNRIKRLVREGFRRHCAELKRFDVVVLAQKGIDYQNRRQLAHSLLVQLKKLKQ